MSEIRRTAIRLGSSLIGRFRVPGNKLEKQKIMLDQVHLDEFGVFVIGMAVEDRPVFKDWAKARGAISVSVIGTGRPVSEYSSRISQVAKPLIIVGDDHLLKVDDFEYLKSINCSLARVFRSNAQFTLTWTDPITEIAKHPHTLENVLDVDEPEGSDIEHLLFSGCRENTSLTNGRNYRIPADQVSPSDITMIICIRAHEKNPWVLDRLSALGEFYSPRPQIQIVDFGSGVDYSEKIEQICSDNNFNYVYVDDQDIFSLAKARNVGASTAETDLLFFSDIDFVFPSNFFGDLAATSSALAARSRIDVFLICAAVHMSEAASAQFIALPSPQERSIFLRQMGYQSIYERFDDSVQFVAPYSNVFLINRKLFSLSGGYDENFRGHGSEDFEFISRVNLFTGHFPIPSELTEDTGGPTKSDFFKSKSYKGFRALNTATALPGQLHGLRAFHVYHPTPGDSWRANNDWKRSKLKETMDRYSDSPERVLEVDFIKRDKKALCVCLHKDHWGYFAPLRLAGYEILPVYDGAVKIITEITQMITSGKVDVLAIYNPYMDSHRKFLGVFHLAKKYCKTIVIERGALPGTIYYSDDVAYISHNFSSEAFSNYQPTTIESEAAEDYISKLRLGNSMLEDADPYGFTTRKYSPLAALDRTIVFIPMQMAEDMAVTMFIRDAQRYDDFASSINDLAAKNPDLLFVVKPHPLTKGAVPIKGANVIIAERNDNVHALIDLSSAVVAYNSGVSLLAMAHEKPVWTIGNAYFNRGGAGYEANSLSEAIKRIVSGTDPVDRNAIVRVYAWLLSKMYSTFSATDNVREFQTRKAHGYKDIIVTSLIVDGERIDATRARANAKDISLTLGSSLLNYGEMAR